MWWFDAVLIDKDPAGQQQVTVTQLPEGDLPDGDVTVRVGYSTLNYKDALAITGTSPVVRQFRMVPGIDFAGVVERSEHPDHTVGDRVVLNGWGVGERHWAGLAELARVSGDWLIPLDPALSFAQAMGIGTAGYSAMLCVLALERQGVTPGDGELLVTGAAGGVGSVAVAMLSRLGYRVVAATGRPAEADYLRRLGAADIVDGPSSPSLGSHSERSVGRERSTSPGAGARQRVRVDALPRHRRGVRSCQPMTFPATVAPFVLRGVTLVGIDSVMCPRDERLKAWGGWTATSTPRCWRS